MPNPEQMPATDSAREIHDLVGDDSTATFESDPKFIDNDTDAEISSNNLQDRSDREEIQNAPSLKASAVADEDDEDDEDEDDDDEDEDDEDDADEVAASSATGLRARTVQDGENTEVPRSGERDAPEDAHEPLEDVDSIEQQDTDVVADKALRMSALLAGVAGAAQGSSIRR